MEENPHPIPSSGRDGRRARRNMGKPMTFCLLPAAIAGGPVKGPVRQHAAGPRPMPCPPRRGGLDARCPLVLALRVVHELHTPIQETRTKVSHFEGFVKGLAK